MSLKRILIEINQRQIAYMSQRGAKVIDWLQTEDYEIFLFSYNIMRDEIGVPYQIAFQRKGHDFTDFEDVFSKSIPDNVSIKDLRKVGDKIEEWLQEYKPIAVGSNNPKKSDVYKRIFERLGFDVDVKMWQGQKVVILRG